MPSKRQGIEAELGRVSGSVLTPVRWVVLLGILASFQLNFELGIDRQGLLIACVLYAAAAAGLPYLRGRPFSRYGIERLLLAVDVLFSGAVFGLTGGIGSPYFGLWYLAVIHAALLLGPRPGLGLGLAIAIAVFASEWGLSGARQWHKDVNLSLGKIPFLPLIAWTAGRLAQELREREAARRRAERQTLELQAAEERIRQEMEIARRVQESLLPIRTPAPAGLTIASLSWPAREVGGDTYDLIELPDGRLLIAVADVSGKGVPAALLTVAVLQGLRQHAGADPAAVLAGVNDGLRENMPEEMFVTAACVVLNPEDGSAAAAVAGHPPPLWWDSAKGRLTPVRASGVALGLLPEWVGRTERWSLSPGDALILYTDGVLDVKIGPSARLGEERIAELLAEAAPVDAQEWIDRLRRALQGCLEWPDDITAVAITRLPVSFPARHR